MTVATRMTAGAVTVGEHAGLQRLVDVVDGRRAPGVTVVAVVDDFDHHRPPVPAGAGGSYRAEGGRS